MLSIVSAIAKPQLLEQLNMQGGGEEGMHGIGKNEAAQNMVDASSIDNLCTRLRTFKAYPHFSTANQT